MSLFNAGSSAAKEEANSSRNLDVHAHTSIGEAPLATASSVDSITNVDTSDDNESDGPLLPSRRYKRRRSCRSTGIVPQAFSAYSVQPRSPSMERRPTTALNRCKRLCRRNGLQRDSPTPDHNGFPTARTASTSGGTEAKGSASSASKNERSLGTRRS